MVHCASLVLTMLWHVPYKALMLSSNVLLFSSTCIWHMIIADFSFGHLFRLSLVANWKFQGTSCLHRSSAASSLWHQRCNCNIAKAKFVLLLHQRWRGSTYNYKWSWDTQSYKKILLFFSSFETCFCQSVFLYLYKWFLVFF